MHSYVCRVGNKEFVRKEHIDHKCLTKDKLMTLDWAPADIPIVKKITEGAFDI
jgi:8-oxo-dGTP diphosphatase